mgnify:CR=1 FL=1
MQKETEFIRSMVEKLKTQSDITQNEAIRIFILAMIMYTYEMGEAFENQCWRDFHDKFDYTEASEVLKEWSKKCFRGYQIIDKWINIITLLRPFLRPCYAHQQKLKRI